MRRSIRSFNIPSGNPSGIWTFQDWLVQIPASRPSRPGPDQNYVQMPHPKLNDSLCDQESHILAFGAVVEFFACKHHSTTHKIVFLSQSLPKIGSSPFKFAIKRVHYAGQTWHFQFKCTPPRKGSNFPLPPPLPRAWMMPLICLWVARGKWGCWSSELIGA